jgi:hypothetical protein
LKGVKKMAKKQLTPEEYKAKLEIKEAQRAAFSKSFFSALAVLLSLVMVVAVVCIPGLNGAFNTCFMKWWCYLVVAGAGLLVVAYMEIFKFIKNKINK